jgi:hypothetical protein
MHAPHPSNCRDTQTSPAPEAARRPLEDFRIATQLIDKYRPGLDETITESMRERIFFHIDRLRQSFGDIHAVKGMQIIDVACGSRCYPDNNGGKYDPWMSRLLVSLGATPLGIDIAEQQGEAFRPHQADLTVLDALASLESSSVDAYYICAFPTCKAIARIVEKGLTWPAIRENILSHLNRALKPGGVIIRKFTSADEELVSNTLKNLSKPAETPAATMPPPYIHTMWRHYEDDDL